MIRTPKGPAALCVTIIAVLVTAVPTLADDRPAGFDARAAQRFADLALACVHKDYPNKISHVLNSDADVKPPRELTPAFCGCFDWHSAVHGHWLLARLVRTFPDAPFVAPARAAAGRQPHPRAHRRRGRLSPGPGPIGLRASLRPRLAAAARRRASRVAGPAGARVGTDARSPGEVGRGADRRVAAQALIPDPHRRARADRLCLRPDSRLGAQRRRARRRGEGRGPQP